MVPVVMLAAAIGREVPEGATSPVVALLSTDEVTSFAVSAPHAAFDVATLLVVAWVLGLFVWLSMRVAAQWCWRRCLGLLRHIGEDIAYAAEDSAVGASLPAATGWPRAIVVLPADFDARFSAVERGLVLEHERRHVTRGDLHAQVVAEIVLALMWFHPLAHWAASRFRHDQELACDADVLSHHPQNTATYARALAKAAGLRISPVATAWGFSHPLKERIAMLHQPLHSVARHRAGLVIVTLLLALVSGLAWASLTREPGAPPEGMLRQTWTLTIDGGEKRGPFVLVEAPGMTSAIEFENSGETWRLESAATALADATFDVAATLTRDGEVVAQPRLVIDPQGGVIQVGTEGPAGFRGVRAEVKVESGEGLTVAAQVPTYPDGVASAGVEGRVMLRVAVDAEGRATDVRVEESSGNVALDAAAQSAARQWRFRPALKGGEPVAGEVLVPVDFRANGENAESGT